MLFSQGEADRRAFKVLMLKNYEYQSDFARKYFADGRSEGLLEGERMGELKTLARPFERRLAQSLTAEERTRLTPGIHALGAERVGESVLHLTPEAPAASATSLNGR